jgi:hypothetical protein
VNAYRAVNHVQVLENLAAHDHDGGYVGALRLDRCALAQAI